MNTNTIRKFLLAPILVVATGIGLACSSSSNGAVMTQSDGGGGGDTGSIDAGVPTASNIKHLVVIVQENQTFDSHFGAYCTATAGSNPTCNDGPACCEAMPAHDPSGATPVTLDDTMLGSWDPSHLQSCENAEMDSGAMDKYTNAPGCGDPRNVAIADPTIIKPYWDLVGQNALADRYFQSASGQSAENDMYFARAKFVFLDNTTGPQGAVGVSCQIDGTPQQYSDPTIGDLMTAANVSWTFFAEGYQRASDAATSGKCMEADPGCPAGPSTFYPCTFDPGDVPFDYFASTVDNPSTLQDLSNFTSALTSGAGLPSVSYVKGLGYKTEHPGFKSKLSDGVAFVTGIIHAIEASSYASSTLVIVTYDESGGYFDHVAPPATSTVDNQPYGPRLPTFAVGPFVKKNFVSHVQMEHASIVKFIEWNWLGQQTGQLNTRDKAVANIGSLLDPIATGTAVPEN